MRRAVALFPVIASMSSAAAAQLASVTEEFIGTAFVYTDAAERVVIHLDTAPSDGTTDVTWVFEPDQAIQGGIAPTTLSITAQYRSEGLGRLILNDTAGRLHLDLAATHLPLLQPGGTAVRNVVAQGPVLRCHRSETVVATLHSHRVDIAVGAGVATMRVDSRVTRSPGGAVAIAAEVGLHARNDLGEDAPLALTPEEVHGFRAIARNAYEIAKNGGFAPQSCYDECMEDADCSLESTFGAPWVGGLAATLTKKPLWGAAGTVVAVAACQGANALGCSIGCGPESGGPDEPPCEAGSVCMPECPWNYDQTGTCQLDQDPGACCAITCWNPPFDC